MKKKKHIDDLNKKSTNRDIELLVFCFYLLTHRHVGGGNIRVEMSPFKISGERKTKKKIKIIAYLVHHKR